jgi:PPM family protein phosphatase
MGMQIDWGSDTHVGRIRDGNEDSILTLEELSLGVLCDGMGGHLAGEVASRVAVNEFVASYGESFEQVAGDAPLFPAVGMANAAILAQAETSVEMRGMGCTLVALRLIEGSASFVSVGDSRLYLCRGGDLHQISEDHTRLRMLERMGIVLDPLEAKRIRGVLTRALGTQPDIEVDCGHGPTVEGDVWLLCSDGLTDEISDGEIRAILRDARDARTAAQTCVQQALKAGGRDNISAIVARVVRGPAPTGEEELPKVETVMVRTDPGSS